MFSLAESPPVTSPKLDTQVHLTVKDATGNDFPMPDVSLTNSSPDEGTGRPACNSGAGMSNTDSVGQGIDESSLTALLPRAVPSVKTFSRRKMKTVKPLKSLAQEFLEENKILKVPRLVKALVEYFKYIQNNNYKSLMVAYITAFVHEFFCYKAKSNLYLQLFYRIDSHGATCAFIFRKKGGKHSYSVC